MTDFIRKKRKKKAREIRKGKGSLLTAEGKPQTHRMESGHVTNKKGKKTYVVNPSISPTGKGGKYEPQTYKEAVERGEVFAFKNKRRAERFAAGSWKKGKDKREAMKDYRAERKKKRKESYSTLKKAVSRIKGKKRYK
jgi:hypothetical protein